MSPMFIGASDSLGDVLVPYDDDGFYGGSIILMFLIYFIWIPMAFFLGVGGVITYFVFPQIIQEFKLIITLYDRIELQKAFARHAIHLLIFTPVVMILLYFVEDIFQSSYWYLFALFIFLISSFFGFYVFLYFAMALYLKNWKKILIALVLGGGVFLFFASSGYFVFEPIYKVYQQKQIEQKSE